MNPISFIFCCMFLHDLWSILSHYVQISFTFSLPNLQLSFGYAIMQRPDCCHFEFKREQTGSGELRHWVRRLGLDSSLTS